MSPPEQRYFKADQVHDLVTDKDCQIDEVDEGPPIRYKLGGIVGTVPGPPPASGITAYDKQRPDEWLDEWRTEDQLTPIT